MSDLIQRLRSQAAVDARPHEIEQLTDEAADAIESSNARIADLLTQLEQKELARKTLAMGYEHASKRAAELEADAARYRWLREQGSDVWKRIGWNTWNDVPEVFPYRDREIDSDMAKEQK
jgi:chromosome segregation ATPase